MKDQMNTQLEIGTYYVVVKRKYKNRMIATGFAFLVASLFLSSSFYIVLIFLIFSGVFLLKSIMEAERN